MYIYRVHPACLSANTWAKINRWANGNNYWLGKCWILQWVYILWQVFFFFFSKNRLISTEFDSFVACQGTLQMSFRRHMCPSSAMLYATLLITTTTRSPLPCSVPVMRKEALMLVRSVFSSVYVFWCTNLVFLCPLIHLLAFLYLGGLFDLLNLWHRETAAVPSWQKTVCPRPAGIGCTELWAGEPAVLWPRNRASTPKFPDFFPGYLQPWGWETLFLLWSLFVIIPEENVGVTDVFVLVPPTNRAITTYQGCTNWLGHEIGYEALSRPCRGQKGLTDG